MITKTRIVDFIDFGGHKIFSAGIQTMVFVLLKKEKPKKYLLNYRRLINDQASLEILEDFLQENKEFTGQYYTIFPVLFDRSEFSGNYISFVPHAIDLRSGRVFTRAYGKYQYINIKTLMEKVWDELRS